MAATDTLEHILFLARRFDRKSIRQVVIMILLELRFPTHHEGFDFLVTAIVLCIEDSRRIALSNIYEETAELYRGCRAEVVDQAIRRVIKQAWRDGDIAIWMRYFPTYRGEEFKMPTNMVFITMIARVVELWTGCREVYAEIKEEVVSK